MNVKGTGLPLKTWVEIVFNGNYATPDIHQLQVRYDYIPLFVYGTEQYKYSEYHLLRDMPRLGMGYTVEDSFVMYKTSDNEPVIFTKPGAPEAAKVKGEMYLVPPDIIFALDQVHQNTVFTRRRWAQIKWFDMNTKDKKPKRWMTSEAMMYVGRYDAWESTREKGKLKMAGIITARDTSSYYMFHYLDDLPNRQAIAKATPRQVL